jgi:hypothetical protein
MRAARSGHAQGVCPRWGGYANRIWIVFSTAFNTVSWRQEGVEALNEGGMAVEQRGNPLDDTWGVNAIDSLSVPSNLTPQTGEIFGNSRLTLKVLHYIQEPIIHIGLVYESHLHLIQIAEGILFHQRYVSPRHVQ